MGNIYNEVKVGDMVYAGRKPYRQIFFIHNILYDTTPRHIIASGFSEGGGIFRKDWGWAFDCIANEDEEFEFMEIAREKGYKFDRNNGFSR